ncbi:MAG: DUF6069 family protein [bacterium]|nr:DUF6069 family protein [bacterium]
MSTSAVAPKPGVNIGKVARNTAITIVIASIVNVIIGLLATSVFGVASTELPMQIPVIIAATVAYLIVAGIVFAVIASRGGNTRRTWTIVVVVALLLSFIPVLSLASGNTPPMPLPEGLTMNPTTGLLIALSVMHIASAVVAWVVMPRD